MHSTDQQDLPGTQLLRLARSSIEYGCIHREPLPVHCDKLSPALKKPGASFTTLRFDDELRGCSRFDPVRKDELDVIRLEVSVLSPLEPMIVTDEADLLGLLTSGTDGLVIVADGRRATFLPKAWEILPDPQQFLAALKAKCGLAEDYWSERLEFQRYRTTTYAESA
jgi:AMMECR1 domain-containing protein